MRKYKCVIIGCGNIAGGYDSKSDRHVLTHAHAILLHKKTTLSGVFDISYKKACRFAKKWNTRVFKTMDAMFKHIMPDLVYVCVPTEVQLRVLEDILAYLPKAVICEKPFGNSPRKAKEVIKKYRKKRVPLAVNLNRRFDGAVRRVKKDIASGHYGRLINGALIYTKGILHNGSHAIDTLRFLFGNVSSYQVLDKVFDCKRSDPDLDALIKFGNKKVYLLVGRESYYSIFEIDLLFSKARIRFEDFGFYYTVQPVQNDRLFSGYRVLKNGQRHKTDLHLTLLRLIDNVVDNIEKGQDLICTGEDAVRTQEICLNLIAESKKYDRR